MCVVGMWVSVGQLDLVEVSGTDGSGSPGHGGPAIARGTLGLDVALA